MALYTGSFLLPEAEGREPLEHSPDGSGWSETGFDWRVLRSRKTFINNAKRKLQEGFAKTTIPLVPSVSAVNAMAAVAAGSLRRHSLILLVHAAHHNLSGSYGLLPMVNPGEAN